MLDFRYGSDYLFSRMSDDVDWANLSFEGLVAHCRQRGWGVGNLPELISTPGLCVGLEDAPPLILLSPHFGRRTRLRALIHEIYHAWIADNGQYGVYYYACGRKGDETEAGRFERLVSVAAGLAW